LADPPVNNGPLSHAYSRLCKKETELGQYIAHPVPCKKKDQTVLSVHPVSCRKKKQKSLNVSSQSLARMERKNCTRVLPRPLQEGDTQEKFTHVQQVPLQKVKDETIAPLHLAACKKEAQDQL
jgi:hypothetical protein